MRVDLSAHPARTAWRQGNYVSRFVVSNVALTIGLLQYIIWQPEFVRTPPPPAQNRFPASPAPPQLLLPSERTRPFPQRHIRFARQLMCGGMLAAFCLSVAGAICDANYNSQCRGNYSLRNPNPNPNPSQA